MCALEHGIGGVPARARVEDGLLPRSVALFTQTLELVGTLRRRAYPVQKTAELGDAWLALRLRGHVAVGVGVGVGVWCVCLQLAQERLHSQIHDVSDASNVLLLLVERDAAIRTGAFEALHSLADVGSVVGGHAQKLVKYSEPLARPNERSAQILTRVLIRQGDKVEDERLHGPAIVDVVAGDPQESLVVGRCPAVERDGDFTGCVTQSLTNPALLLMKTLHNIALDSISRRNRDAGGDPVDKRAKICVVDGRERLIAAHYPSDKELPDLFVGRRRLGVEVRQLRGSGEERKKERFKQASA